MFVLYGLLVTLLISCVSTTRNAYVTYHMYTPGQSLGTVACSDGANGLMTKTGLSTISKWYPYVTAYSGTSWNTPTCGQCVSLQDHNTGNTVSVTIIDGCGNIAGYTDHFDLAQDAFVQLFGSQGINAGHGTASFSFVDSSLCGSSSTSTSGLLPSTTTGGTSLNSVVGIWWWTWSQMPQTPQGTNLGIAFSGWVDPSSALSDSQAVYSKLPGYKILSLGGGNANGRWTAPALNSIIQFINSGQFDSYDGIAFDIEEGDSGLASLFGSAFAAAKNKGRIVIVTISHAAPYGVGDAALLMRGFFNDQNIDYISPQLYTTGQETSNDYSTNMGISWSEYSSSKAAIVPSLVSGSMYSSAQTYFQTHGITLKGYIQWQQNAQSTSGGPSTNSGGSTSGGSTGGTIRCGLSWSDANFKCGVPCPSGTDAPCPAGERCFKDIAPCSGGSPTGKTPGGSSGSPTGGSIRCGLSWWDANAKCGVACPSGTDAPCPAGERCFKDIAFCAGSSGGTAAGEGSVATENPGNSNSDASSDGTMVGTDGQITIVNDIPGWSIALLVIGSVLTVMLLVVVVVILFKKPSSERV
eukprot:TRINITY_DN2615_c0_g1_i1.p1 TRINITY_DN2615_c0_g1~~TRINITY_DN2615_c0_g1_i1.p1  ORF type:complete len:580 (+),score=68.60 TRINITY_DN2615_c0_g1_i1:35-1774(+)